MADPQGDGAGRIRRACRTAGRALATAVAVLLATLGASSDKANAPMLPPDTAPMPRRDDYRP